MCTLLPAYKSYQLFGFPFQVMLIFGFIYQSYCMIENSDFSSSDPEILYVTRFFGMLITVHSMRRIYIRKQKKLITDGLFRYSRHPMYIGLTLLAMDVWWPRVEPLPLLYFVSLSAFAVGITVAGFFQEKETLALYGKEAEEYYARTPRFLGIPRKG